jgi:hypothetical protein
MSSATPSPPARRWVPSLHLLSAQAPGRRWGALGRSGSGSVGGRGRRTRSVPTWSSGSWPLRPPQVACAPTQSDRSAGRPPRRGQLAPKGCVRKSVGVEAARNVNYRPAVDEAGPRRRYPRSHSSEHRSVSAEGRDVIRQPRREAAARRGEDLLLPVLLHPFSNPTSSRPDAAGAAALAGTANTSAPMHAATSAARDLI